MDVILLRATAAVLLLTAMTAGTAAHSDTFELERGETLELEPYVLSFESSPVPDRGSFLALYRQTESDTDMVLEKLYSEQMFGGERVIEGESVRVEVNSLGWTGSGQSLNLTVSSEEDIFSDAELSSGSPERVIAARGDSLSFDLELENSGTLNQSYSLESSSPPGVEVSYGYMGFNVSSVEVPASESRELEATVEVLEEAEVGEHNITFVARGESEVSERFLMEVRGKQKEREVELELEDRSESVRPGDTLRPEAQIFNRGEAPLRSLEVEVTAPDGWTVRDYGRRVTADRLDVRDREYYRPIVDVPSNAEPGDYFVEVQAQSEEASSETRQIRVNVSSSSGLSLVGVGLMAVSLVGMAAVYWRLGRR